MVVSEVDGGWFSVRSTACRRKDNRHGHGSVGNDNRATPQE